jgi:protein-tyrosine-phosphatase
VKSAIAREILKRRARERGIPVHAWSRGLVIEDHVSPALAARLSADRIDPQSEPARVLAAGDVKNAGIVIAFDEAAHAPGLEVARVWDTPGFLADYDGAKAAVQARVEALLEELQARHC